MVQFDNQYKQVKLKVVFYGPALGGKTTCLQHIHRVTDPPAAHQAVRPRHGRRPHAVLRPARHRPRPGARLPADAPALHRPRPGAVQRHPARGARRRRRRRLRRRLAARAGAGQPREPRQPDRQPARERPRPQDDPDRAAVQQARSARRDAARRAGECAQRGGGPGVRERGAHRAGRHGGVRRGHRGDGAGGRPTGSACPRSPRRSSAWWPTSGRRCSRTCRSAATAAAERARSCSGPAGRRVPADHGRAASPRRCAPTWR